MRDTAIRGVRLAAAASPGPGVAAGAAACGSAARPHRRPGWSAARSRPKVSASGALAPVSSQNLGFRQRGAAGRARREGRGHRARGQVLAREDPFSYQQLLNQQQAS